MIISFLYKNKHFLLKTLYKMSIGNGNSYILYILYSIKMFIFKYNNGVDNPYTVALQSRFKTFDVEFF